MGFVDQLPAPKAKEKFEAFVKTFGDHTTAAKAMLSVLRLHCLNKPVKIIEDKSRPNEAGMLAYGFLIIPVNDPVEYQRLRKFVFYEEDEEKENENEEGQ